MLSVDDALWLPPRSTDPPCWCT